MERSKKCKSSLKLQNCSVKAESKPQFLLTETQQLKINYTAESDLCSTFNQVPQYYKFTFDVLLR